MKTYRASQGPFAERPHYSPAEIENTCSDELRKAKLYPESPQPIRIERFIEKRFGVTPAYEELPDGLLGFTKFGPKGVEEIVVSKSLAESGDKVSDRRLSTTLAHEAGHGLFQAHLFALGSQPASLFGGGLASDSPKILCREDGIPGRQKTTAYDGRWWEFQANQAIGALLLPRPLVDVALEKLLSSVGSFGLRTLPAKNWIEGVKLLSEVFAVNPIVATIRLEQLYPRKRERQLTL
jgi:hypothetical protein